MFEKSAVISRWTFQQKCAECRIEVRSPQLKIAITPKDYLATERRSSRSGEIYHDRCQVAAQSNHREFRPSLSA